MVRTDGLQASLLRVGEWVAENGIEAAGPHAAARKLLMRQGPLLQNGAPLRAPDETALEAALRIAPTLDGEWLGVQGPPGSGKTYLGAEVAVELVSRGLRVGVTANSHRVIGHLLDKIAERAAARGASVAIGQRTDAAGDCASDAATPFGSYPELLEALQSGEVQAVGGTAWLLFRHADVYSAYRDSEHFPSSASYTRIAMPTMGRTMQCMEGEEHRIKRALVSGAFLPAAVRTQTEQLLRPLAIGNVTLVILPFLLPCC